MKVARKLLVTGGASLILAGGVLALPPAQSVGATSVESMRKPVHGYTLRHQSEASFDLKTEVDPGSHVLWSTVTNKTRKSLTPRVTFNNEPSAFAGDAALKPGESRKYAHYFTGNNFIVNVKVEAKGARTLSSPVTVNILEPVTFQASESNDKTVAGTLKNNSTLVAQTAYIKSYDNQVSTINLEPGESREITVPYTYQEGQKAVGVTVATGSGYESIYTVALTPTPTQPTPDPLAH